MILPKNTNRNSFYVTCFFQNPLKTSENQSSDVFRGVSKENSGMKWVKLLNLLNCIKSTKTFSWFNLNFPQR